MFQIIVISLSLLLSAAGPKTDVELLRTPIKHKRTDIYLSVLNPNDFSICVPKEPQPSTIVNSTGEITCLDYKALTYPDDFVMLHPGEKMLFQVYDDYHLKSGRNMLKITFGKIFYESSGVQPGDDVVLEYREMSIVVDLNK